MVLETTKGTNYVPLSLNIIGFFKAYVNISFSSADFSRNDVSVNISISRKMYETFLLHEKNIETEAAPS